MNASRTVRAALRLVGPLAAIAVVAAVAAAGASAAPPTYTAIPTIEGPTANPFVGDTLRATTGTWTGSPTKYAYQWDRCDAVGDRRNCAPITGATSSTYRVQKADVDHTLRVRVTATNADGSATKDSKGTGVVADNTAPKNTARPQVTGSATVGSTLTATTGTWTGATTYSFQWQQCSSGGNNCTDIAGSTGRTYGVRSADVGHELRVEVTATNRFGSSKATSPFTDVVSGGSTTTTVVTTTTAANRAPTVRFLALSVRSNRVSARFRVCDDSPGRITVIERDQKARTLAYTRRFGVSRSLSCGTFTRSWALIARFRTRGRFVVTLRALDSSRRLSLPASRSVLIR
jgi:fibronectin-binding autotransporter adhesin